MTKKRQCFLFYEYDVKEFNVEKMNSIIMLLLLCIIQCRTAFLLLLFFYANTDAVAD